MSKDKKDKSELQNSRLEEIEGIGAKKAQLLLKTFGSMAAVKRADIDELARVKGITSSDAMRIVAYFEKKNEDT